MANIENKKEKLNKLSDKDEIIKVQGEIIEEQDELLKKQMKLIGRQSEVIDILVKDNEYYKKALEKADKIIDEYLDDDEDEGYYVDLYDKNDTVITTKGPFKTLLEADNCIIETYKIYAKEIDDDKYSFYLAELDEDGKLTHSKFNEDFSLFDVLIERATIQGEDINISKENFNNNSEMIEYFEKQ